MKEEVLHHLSRGCGVTECCRLVNVSRSAYYAWRRTDPEFKASCDRLLRDPVHIERITRGLSVAASDTTKSWQEKFVSTYNATGDREQALIAAAQSALHIEACLAPSSEHYDPDFHRAFQQAEQRRLWRIEDNLLNKAEHDSPSARFILANRVKDKYGKLEGGTTINNNTAWFTVEGEQRAVERMRRMFGPTEDGATETQELHAPQEVARIHESGSAA